MNSSMQASRSSQGLEIRVGLLLGLAMACADGADETIVRSLQPNAPSDNPAAEPAAARDSDPANETARIPVPEAPTDAADPVDAAAADAGRVVSPPRDAGGLPDVMPAFDVPCTYRVFWDIQVSHEGCSAFSPLLSARTAHWDGERLSLLEDSVRIAGGRVEDLRSCTLLADTWRYDEALELTSPLPERRCEGVVTANYRYDECLFLYGGDGVCSAEPGDPSADRGTCSVRAVATLVPYAAGGEVGAVEPEGDDGTPSVAANDAGVPVCSSERTPDGVLTRPIPIGEPCYATRFCEAGSYCVFPTGEDPALCLSAGTCQPAPRLADCTDEVQESATCDEGCQRSLPLRNNALANPCKVRAIMGLTVLGEVCVE